VSVDYLKMQRGLLHRALKDEAVMALAAAQLGNAYRFDEPELTWIWQVTKKCYDENGEAPTEEFLVASIDALPEASQDATVQQLTAVFRARMEEKPRSTLQLLRARARKQGLIEASERASEQWSKGNDEGAEAILTEAATTSEARPGPSAKPMFPKKINFAKTPPRIPTGLAMLDQRIGGIQRGEVGMVMGVSGMGKSAAMVTLGHACLRNKFKLLHIDTENGEPISRARYLSRFTNIPAKLIESNQMTKAQRERLDAWLDRNHDRLKNEFRVIYLNYMENTIEDVEAAIVAEIRGGFVPDEVLFDSPDHLYMKNGQARWEQFADTANRIKGLAQRRNVGLWFTSQADLAFEGKIATMAATADSKQKPRVASLVLTINPLLDPMGKPIDDRKCIYVAKARNDPSRYALPLQTKLETMTITCYAEGDDDRERAA
jgi:hypothetical protein